MTVAVDFKARPAVPADHRQLSTLMHFSPHVHRHLDWRYPLDWIGTSPFYVLENNGQISTALACPPDPPHVAWVRLFLNSGRIPIQESWRILWEMVRLDLGHDKRILIAAIVLQDWLTELLLASGFTSRQSIVMLERQGGGALDVGLPRGFSLRPMRQIDLPAVAEVDAAAFDSLWHNSLQALELAYPQAVVPTIVEAAGKVV